MYLLGLVFQEWKKKHFHLPLLFDCVLGELINKNLLFHRRCPNRSRSPTLSLKKEYILDRFWNRGGSLFNVLNRGYPAHAWPDFLQNNRGRFGLIFDIGILYIKNKVCSQYNDIIELLSARPVYSKSTASVWR